MREFGVLSDPILKEAFTRVNEGYYCDLCRKERASFAERDKKQGQFSNRLPGFSSQKAGRPTDVFIVAHAHAGTDLDRFRRQKTLDDEMSEMADYYRGEPDKSFHQQQVRLLLERLDEMDKSWVFADVVKCFVWKKGSDGEQNLASATKHCGQYLEAQLQACRPRRVVTLGDAVDRALGIPKLAHGASAENAPCAGLMLTVVHSMFPSGRTADAWIRAQGWKPVLESLSK